MYYLQFFLKKKLYIFISKIISFNKFFFKKYFYFYSLFDYCLKDLRPLEFCLRLLNKLELLESSLELYDLSLIIGTFKSF
jgi:hypothetical protein